MRTAFTIVLVVAATARAHDFAPRRTVLVDVGEEATDLLVAFDLPAGALADRIARVVDLDGDGRLGGPLEELAARQRLGARAIAGLDVGARWIPDASEIRWLRGAWQARFTYRVPRCAELRVEDGARRTTVVDARGRRVVEAGETYALCD